MVAHQGFCHTINKWDSSEPTAVPGLFRVSAPRVETATLGGQNKEQASRTFRVTPHNFRGTSVMTHHAELPLYDTGRYGPLKRVLKVSPPLFFNGI